ncbi:hypothetical protein CDL12_14468 [Handroanthus impetiginosus]|uniref:Uncharacterized protein n=1 Tax=Handroanthus impetiginosus TaxID=429701 RepID=A0A2G9H6I6_9LAMI|nr:hypothetical protein CDL12_14468 [Handroanthus impetiginosus]
MSIALQTIFTNKNPAIFHVPLSLPTHSLKPSNLLFSPPNSRTHFQNYRFLTSQPNLFPVTKIKAAFDEPYGTSQSQVNGSSSTLNDFDFDAFLSILEFLSIAASAAISLYVALSNGVVQKGGFLGWIGSKVLVWQSVILVSGVVVAAVIRRRQWNRICGAGNSRGSPSYGVDLLGRVEKLEEDLRSSSTIIRVLSRQLEKLVIRFRVTRKALKEPIAETAALAQKNSEATRALAAQEDILEKELGEIQNVLLAMQEQQQKQLDLILAIGQAGKLFETERAPTTEDPNASDTSTSSVDGAPNVEINKIDTPALEKQSINDRA